METTNRLDPFMRMSVYICRYLGSNMSSTCSELGGKKGRISVSPDVSVDDDDDDDDDVVVAVLMDGSHATESTPSSNGS